MRFNSEVYSDIGKIVDYIIIIYPKDSADIRFDVLGCDASYLSCTSIFSADQKKKSPHGSYNVCSSSWQLKNYRL